MSVALIAGADSSTHRGAYLSALAGRFGEVEVIVVPDATHLVPMERPDVVAAAIRDARGHR